MLQQSLRGCSRRPGVHGLSNMGCRITVVLNLIAPQFLNRHGVHCPTALIDKLNGPVVAPPRSPGTLRIGQKTMRPKPLPFYVGWSW